MNHVTEHPSGLLPADAKQLERFLTRSIGNGFAASAVKVTNPQQLERVIDWMKTVPGLEDANFVETDLGELPGNNVWFELGERWRLATPGDRHIALISGLEHTHKLDNTWPVLGQLNVQRDALARDFSWPWVLFLHPDTARQLRLDAPDFHDYVGLWVEVPQAETTPLRAYLLNLLDDTSHIDIQGIGTRHGQGKTALSYPIEDLYTPLRTRAWPKLDMRQDPGEAHEAREQLVDLCDVLPRSRHLLIEGQPGAGKTTFLRYIACMLARDALDVPGPEGKRWGHQYLGLPEDARWGIPLFLRASSLVPLLNELSSTQRCDRHLLAVFIEQVSSVDSPGIEKGQWSKLLEADEVLVLLDGLDEVASGELRRRLFDMLRDAVQHWKSSIIVSSRPIETSVLSEMGFLVVTVEPFGRREIANFVMRWVQGLRESTNVPVSLRKVEKHRDELLSAIMQSPQIRMLAENPVMLTCLCVVHFNEGKLPEGRSRLYSAVIEWMLRSRSDRRRRAGYGDEFARRAFAHLALGMMTTEQGKRSTVSFDEATAMIVADLRRQFPKVPDDELGNRGERWLEFECEVSGIVQELSGRQLRFWHLTFEEYLAALALSWQLASGDKWWTNVVSRHLEEAQWRETIEVLPGCLFDGPGIDCVDNLLDRVVRLLGSNDDLPSQARLAAVLSRLLGPLKVYEYQPPAEIQKAYDQALERSMAIFTLEGAQQVPVKTRIEVAEALGRAGDPRLTPDKDNFIRVPGTSVSLGKYPVTVEEYRHFVDARGYEQSKYWSPEGWAAKTEGQWGAPDEWDEQLQTPNRPVTRVCWYEAEAYCAWKSDHTGQEIRLPTEQEWQAAATAKQGEYPWGEPEPNEELANFAPNFKPNVGHATPVGINPAGNGRYGHCDLAGNVWEWCEDLHNVDKPGHVRVIRGGSWNFYAQFCRSAYRLRRPSSIRDYGLGFRLAAGQ